MTSEMDRFARSHRCIDCQDESSLAVRWKGTAEQCWCPKCGNAEHFESRKSITQRWRENPANVDIATANRLEDKYGRGPMSERALVTIDEKGMLARIEEARWTKDLALPDRKALAGLAVMYHLDPVMAELIIYEGKPYITLNGHLRLANSHPQWAGVTDRPMTKDEREAYGITAPIACLAEVYRKGMAVPARGVGTADPAKPLRNNPLERDHPYRQARARAIRMALRTYFPHGLPLQAAEDRGILVDERTGEIIEGEATELPPEPAPATNPGSEPPTEVDEWLASPPQEAEADYAARWAQAEADLKKESDGQGRTWANVQAHFAGKHNKEWTDLTIPELEAALVSLKASVVRKAGAGEQKAGAA